MAGTITAFGGGFTLVCEREAGRQALEFGRVMAAQDGIVSKLSAPVSQSAKLAEFIGSSARC